MSDKMVLSEDQAIELLAFLVTSSRGVIDEPELYGSFRLMDASSRLLGFMLESGEYEDKEFLAELKDKIDTGKMLVMSDEAEYVAFTEDIVKTVTRWLKSSKS